MVQNKQRTPRGKKQGKGKKEVKQVNKKYKFEEIEPLVTRINEEVPPEGVLYYKYQEGILQQENAKTSTNKNILKTSEKDLIKIRFADLPITQKSIRGLIKSNYKRMTEVQRSTIPHALYGRDMVVCARTGSGKTLSFLIPIIEKMYRERFSMLDGLGALVLVPTRELAIQVFEVLRSFACNHDISAGLVIGGKDVQEEKDHINSMNILVSTPGRLLQHMNETAYFDCPNLKMLVIDEVDRTLDIGFQEDLTEIMTYLPKVYQTLMFSATISKKITQMASKQLRQGFQIIDIHNLETAIEDENGETILKTMTPNRLQHFYMEVKIEDKLDILFSFIQSHKKNKCLVFFQTCKQVRFAYESFKKMQAKVCLLELHGRQKQTKRTAIYYEFVERKAAFLFATDIASRGVDFPAVDWVVQFDCPDVLDTYVHRVGRTARYKSKGQALLLLTTPEIKFLEYLSKMSIDMKKLHTNPIKQFTIQNQLEKINAQSQEVKQLAQRAFITYVRAIHLNSDKNIFNVKAIDFPALSKSLGLITAPVISFGEQEPEKKSKLSILKDKIKKKKEESLLVLKQDQTTIPESEQQNRELINYEKNEEIKQQEQLERKTKLKRQAEERINIEEDNYIDKVKARLEKTEKLDREIQKKKLKQKRDDKKKLKQEENEPTKEVKLSQQKEEEQSEDISGEVSEEVIEDDVLSDDVDALESNVLKLLKRQN